MRSPGLAPPHSYTSFDADTRTPGLVLVVDDHDDSREMYALCLGAVGYRVQQAQDGAAALERAALEQPAIVVTDIRMPGPVSAVDVCRHFHARGVPVIVITGLHAQGPDVHDVLQTGCGTVMIKPVTPTALCDEVRRVLELQRSTAT